YELRSSRQPSTRTDQEPACAQQEAEQDQNNLPYGSEYVRRIVLSHLLAEDVDVPRHHGGEQDHAKCQLRKTEITQNDALFTRFPCYLLSGFTCRKLRDGEGPAIDREEQAVAPMLAFFIQCECVFWGHGQLLLLLWQEDPADADRQDQQRSCGVP